jgi:dTDP-glucose 4,6-dehydratase
MHLVWSGGQRQSCLGQQARDPIRATRSNLCLLEHFAVMNLMRKVMVTGNAGLIGTVAVSRFIAETDVVIVTIDKLTYADNLDSVPGLARHPPQTFEHVDLCDVRKTARVFAQHKPDGVVHLAAESHVSRSIHGSEDFIETRILGTDTLLGAARSDWRGPSLERSAGFRFHHLSTGDVHGSVGDVGNFTEERPYVRHSLCSASKATSGHLVRAWYPTSGIPAVPANCPNNCAPNDFPEKFIPLMILNTARTRRDAAADIRDRPEQIRAVVPGQPRLV